MHNIIQELKGNIRVFCRVRPTDDSQDTSLSLSDTRINLKTDADDYVFQFDHVFAPQASQTEVFDEVEGLVQSALDGYKVCIFAYGQTGSGKTHTMQGSTSSPEAAGLVPRALKKVFDVADKMKAQGWEWSLEVSFMEVYNETIKDLLPSNDEGDRASPADHLIIRHDDWGTMVTGVTRVEVASIKQITTLMNKAAKRRSVGATDMNAQSSRSHSIFAMYLKGTNDALSTELRGALHLVDLAGSERLDKSGATGSRLKETQNINKSLASLSHVFTAKAEGQAHVPFRNSKLTYLMEPCLSGQGKTLMLVNVQAELDNAHETLCSLRFAQQVAQCNTGGKPQKCAKTINKTARVSFAGAAPACADANRRASAPGGRAQSPKNARASLPMNQRATSPLPARGQRK